MDGLSSFLGCAVCAAIIVPDRLLNQLVFLWHFDRKIDTNSVFMRMDMSVL